MQFSAIIAVLTASVASVAAAPATPYNQMQPSERALVDATNLICSQYPNRDWVLIGTLKVDCPEKVTKREAHEDGYKAAAEKRNPGEITVDGNWIVEYKTSPNNLKK